MGRLSLPLHQSSAHPWSPEPWGGHSFEEGDSSRRVEVAPRVGSDDLEPLQGAEVDLSITSEKVHCQLFFSLSHSPLERHTLTSSDQNIATGLMQDQRGASFSDTRHPEPAEPAWFPDLTELLVAPPWPIPIKKDLLFQVDGSRTRSCGAFICGCFGDIREAECPAFSCAQYASGGASTLYETFVFFKMVWSSSYRPGYLHRVGCSEFTESVCSSYCLVSFPAGTGLFHSPQLSLWNPLIWRNYLSKPHFFLPSRRLSA